MSDHPDDEATAKHTVTLKLSPITIVAFMLSLFLLFGVGLYGIIRTNAGSSDTQQEQVSAMGCLVGYTFYRSLVSSTRAGTQPATIPEFGNLKIPSAKQISHVDLQLCQKYIDRAFQRSRK